jgi:hypothetical protein
VKGDRVILAGEITSAAEFDASTSVFGRQRLRKEITAPSLAMMARHGVS